MSTPRVTDAKLQRAREEREYWKMKNEASTLKSEVESLNPEMVETLASNRRGASVGQRLKENYLDALEVRQFRDVVEGNSSRPHQGDPLSAEQKARNITEYAKYLASIGKTPTEIEGHIAKLGPTLDFVSQQQYLNPMFQNALMARTLGGETGEKFGFKDAVETFRVLSEMNGPRQQSDPAVMISAIAKVFEVAQQSRNNGSDPVSAYQAGMAAVTPFLERLNENQKLAFTTQLDSLRNELREKDPVTFFEKMRTFSESLGWHQGGAEDPQVIQHRLDIADRDSQRAYELSKAKWEKEWELKSEDRKQKAQAELLTGITGTIGKALESPVVRELGRNVGQKIGVKNPLAPLSQAQTAAAQNQLQNPLDALYGFKCKCGKDYKFTAGELTKISGTGGKWACPSCGEAYTLSGDGKQGGEPRY